MINQRDRDTALLSLMETVSDAYEFVLAAEELKEVHGRDLKDARRNVLISISQQIVECAYFIQDYMSEHQSFGSSAG